MTEASAPPADLAALTVEGVQAALADGSLTSQSIARSDRIGLSGKTMLKCLNWSAFSPTR